MGWPQGKQFNEEWWQHLEYTVDGYAINTESLILNGRIFANGTNTCMGIFDNDKGTGPHKRASSKTTGPTMPCDHSPHSPIPIPSHFYKILIDVQQKVYWAFLATNDAGPVPQLVPDICLPWRRSHRCRECLHCPLIYVRRATQSNIVW